MFFQQDRETCNTDQTINIIKVKFVEVLLRRIVQFRPDS